MRILHDIAIFQTVKCKVIISLFETVRLSVSISLRNLYNSLNSIKEIYIDICFFFVFFFAIFITMPIQHFCLYSDSPTLLPLIMPRPPAPSAL